MDSRAVAELELLVDAVAAAAVGTAYRPNAGATMLDANLLAAQIGRSPVDFHRATFRVGLRLHIFGIRLTRELHQQPSLRILSLMKQIDVDAIPTFRFQVDFESGHLVGHESIGRGDLL